VAHSLEGGGQKNPYQKTKQKAEKDNKQKNAHTQRCRAEM
jgi:hypothetical protein